VQQRQQQQHGLGDLHPTALPLRHAVMIGCRSFALFYLLSDTDRKTSQEDEDSRHLGYRSHNSVTNED